MFDVLHRAYGLDSVPGTEVDVRIRLPVFAGERLEASAELVSREGGVLEHTVHVRGPHGDAIVGSARVPAK